MNIIFIYIKYIIKFLIKKWKFILNGAQTKFIFNVITIKFP